jgi:opacity protein-like surface antigen
VRQFRCIVARLVPGALALCGFGGGLFGPGAAPARAQVTVSAYLGGSRTHNSDLRIRHAARGTDAVFHGVGWRAEPLEAPWYYGFKVGGFLRARPNWGVELDFTHYKVFAKTDRTVRVSGTWDGAPVDESARMDARVQEFAISHGVNTLALNVLYRWPTGARTPAFPFGRVQPYVGAGPALYILHPENRVNDRPNDQKYQTSGVGWQALAGMRYGLSRRLTAFGEAKYGDGEARVDLADDGRGETRLRTWHAAFGLEYAL